MGIISGKVASMVMAGTLVAGGAAGIVSMTYDGGNALKTVRLWMMDESSKVQDFDQAESKLLAKISALKDAASIKIVEANELIAGKNTLIQDKDQIIANLEQEIEAYLQQITELNAEIENLTGENGRLQAELDSKIAELQETKEQLEQAYGQIVALQEEIGSLTAENERLNQELDKANGEISKANNDAEATKAFINQVKTENHNPMSEEEIEAIDVTLPDVVDENQAE
ncbi:MAG: hypothetical protein ACI4XL_06680 [Bacillus sp. (in: firmicutes)]